MSTTATDEREQAAPPSAPSGPSGRSLTRYDGPRSTAELGQYAAMLAGTPKADGGYIRNDALPAIFRGNPAAVAFAVEYGKALDVSPVTALIGIHIVDGKPTASAGLISALIRRAGHKIRTWTEGSIEEGTFKAVTTIHRFDDPDFEYRSEWSLDRAVRAQLMKREGGRIVAAKPKSAWATYPENMCKARTITEAARDAAEDAVLGVHYTPEELGADVDETGEPVYQVTVVQEQPRPPSNPEPEATPGDLAAMADEVRQQVIAAQDVAGLMAIWNGSIIAGSEAAARKLVTANASGEEIPILDVIALAGEALKHGKRDQFLLTVFGIETVDGEVVDESGESEHTPAIDVDPDEAAAAEHDAGEDQPAETPEEQK